jgi:hypothetical protein
MQTQLTKHLSVNMFAEFGHPLSPKTVDKGPMHNPAHGVDGHLVDEKLKFDEVALLPTGILVVEGGVTLAVKKKNKS